MSPSNANPGAGGARVHGISKSDAASPTRNQVPAQSTSKAYRAAAFILHAAQATGIRVGTDGVNIDMLSPLRVPFRIIRQFERALNEFRAEVIAIIQNAEAV